MEFHYLAEGIDAIVVDGVYTEEEYKSIVDEQISLVPSLMPPNKTAGALSEDGSRIIKSNHGIFIENTNTSKIITTNFSKFTSDNFYKKVIELNPMYKIYRDMDSPSTLLSYYGDGDHYDKHKDASIFTILVYAFKNKHNKKFSGGDVFLYSADESKKATIEAIPNRAIIFPSCTMHGVTPVIANDKFDFNKGDGRFCITHFLNKKDPRL